MVRRFLVLASLVLFSPACGGGEATSRTAADGGPATPPTRSKHPAWGAAPLNGADADLRAAALARDPEHPALLEKLASRDLAQREQAVWTLARIGGEKAARALLPIVDGPAPENAASLYAAFGLLDPPAAAAEGPPEPTGVYAEVEAALWTRYAVTDDDAAAQALLFSLARVGGERSVAVLASDLSVLPPAGHATRYVAAMESLALLCARGHGLTTSALEAVAQGLDATDVRARRVSAYALGRRAKTSAELTAGAKGAVLVERLTSELASGDEELVAEAWRAVGALAGFPKVIPPAILGPKGPPWRVEVQAVRALLTTAKGREEVVGRLSALGEGALEPGRVHPILEAITGLRAIADADPKLVEPLHTLAQLAAARGGSWDSPVQRIACQASVVQAIASGDLAVIAPCRGRPDQAALEVDVIARSSRLADQAGRTAMLIERAQDPKHAGRTAALAALSEATGEGISAVLREAVVQPDVGVASAAAGAIAARALDASTRDPQAATACLHAAQTLTNENEVEARIAAIAAVVRLLPNTAERSELINGGLLALARDPAVAVRRAARLAFLDDPARLAALDAPKPPRFGPDSRVPMGTPASGLHIETSRGAVEISFEGAAAPINQAAFAHLAQSGYFNGLTVHRVVADFVVQGGDPRGDGYGGPGFLLPCEWSNLRYERGSVGVALAGKDTGGSQLFITHGPARHLDGRYTIIGQVSSGMDVVDQLLPHDKIVSVRVRSTP